MLISTTMFRFYTFLGIYLEFSFRLFYIHRKKVLKWAFSFYLQKLGFHNLMSLVIVTLMDTSLPTELFYFNMIPSGSDSNSEALISEKDS